ncbi:MAG: serine protease, partial [Chitinophagaceae bacterium]|nr:serine protease [Chitinophagaceae bacterium]
MNSIFLSLFPKNRNIKKSLLTLLCFLIIAATQAQTLRDAVVVVRPNYTQNTVKFLTDFAASLHRDGYIKAADLLTAYSKGGYGTGILWKNQKDNRYYIITNRHVVAQAKNANIEFMPADSAVVKYKNCPIIAVDESSEMALIALPKEAHFKASLGFSTEKLSDGDEVYSAGFPGLGSDPSWQLGKGIISNNSAKLKNWVLQKSAKIIQHTAQVDPGSSGGPLLVKEKNSSVGYAVVGINTWKVIDRESANFSIAAATMQQFLNNYFAQPDQQSQASLQKKAQDF